MRNILLGVFFLSSLFEVGDTVYLYQNVNKQSLEKESIAFYDCEMNLPSQNYSITQINGFIEEAYPDDFQNLINDNNRYALLVDFFQNRLSFKMDNDYEGKIYKNVSDLELDVKHNLNQQRDLTYDLQTFNPLKYRIKFFPQKTIVYKLGNTPHYMLIKPRR